MIVFRKGIFNCMYFSMMIIKNYNKESSIYIKIKYKNKNKWIYFQHPWISFDKTNYVITLESSSTRLITSFFFQNDPFFNYYKIRKYEKIHLKRKHSNKMYVDLILILLWDDLCFEFYPSFRSYLLRLMFLTIIRNFQLEVFSSKICF